jgi:hypothetical protein
LSSPSNLPPEAGSKGNASTEDKIVLEQMNSEYKILQDKLDKIAGFRTTIRGWSVTLVVASVIAAGSSKQVSPLFLSILFIFIYAFGAMEEKQNRYGAVFGARIWQLEGRIREELRERIKDDPVLGFYPGIAHHIHSRSKKRSSRFLDWFLDADRFFYVAQFGAVAIAMLVLSLIGSAPKVPDTQSIIQIESGRQTYNPVEHKASAASEPPTNSEGPKNVKEKRNQ